jgi:hypothetical protein
MGAALHSVSVIVAADALPQYCDPKRAMMRKEQSDFMLQHITFRLMSVVQILKPIWSSESPN